MITGEARTLLIEGAVTADLLELLDGTRHTHELVQQLSERYPPRAVGGAIRRLTELGVLASGGTAQDSRTAAAWDARGTDPDLAEAWLRNGRVTLIDAGAPTAAVIARALADAGLAVDRIESHAITASRLAAADPGSELVVLPRSYVDPILAGINQVCLDLQRPWTLARPHGLTLLLGPHLVPGRTGCWQCLLQRWQENEQLENYVAAQRPQLPRLDSARAAHASTASVLAGLLLAELPVLAVNRSSPRITGRMIALDTRDLTASEHVLVHQPQCPACGSPELVRQATGRVVISSAASTSDDREPSRTLSLAETWDRLQHHVSRYFGVVSRLAPVAMAGAAGTHTYSAVHNFALARSATTLRMNLRGQSGGKGRTDLQARVGAVCEAVERYCGLWRGELPTRQASYLELGPEEAVNLRQLLHYSDDQYDQREKLNSSLAHFHRIPRRAPDDLVMSWTTGWSLTHQVARAIPAAYCWYGHPELESLGVTGADSNGCAAGNTLAEAVLHGFCELVERDSVALWWHHRSRVPGVDLDSFADPWITQLRRRYEQDHHRDLWALDLTADLGIPAFAAVSACRARPTEDVLVGFGADLDAGVALSRAMAEVDQFLPAVSRYEAGSTRYGLSEPEALRWFISVRVAEHPWLVPDPDVPATTADRHPDRTSLEVADGVAHCVRIAAAAGHEVIVVDQSRPDIELSVARVIVPGLRHFWRRLGPGRLWTIPGLLGREPLAASEHEVNPMNVFF
ncbi:TOMM precursor leader peptide-binding protein [Jatrophihabitans sp.]|uniref:TOMM precursor leader peptide-binding protein n=1 Tax=Jatrophihabitans sp. TaxID=1932789 RepID=UPI002EEFBBCE